MRNYLRSLPTLLSIGLKEAIAYRAEFVVWMLSMTMPLVMLAVMTAVAREGQLGGFGTAQFVTYYLVTLIVRQLTGAWVVWELSMEIRQGTLGLRLLKPIHPLFAIAADSLAAIPMRALISLPITIGLLYLGGGHQLTRDGYELLLFVLALLGSWLLNFSISAIIGTLALYIESSISVWELWLGCFMVLSGYLIPLSLFPAWLERLARHLPFCYIQAMPVELLSGLYTREQALHAVLVQYSYAALALTLMLLFWRKAVARFAAFGG